MQTNFQLLTTDSFYQNAGGTVEVAHTNAWQNPNDDDCSKKLAFQTTAYRH